MKRQLVHFVLVAILQAGVILSAPASADSGTCDERWEACNSQVWCPSTRTFQSPYSYCAYKPGDVQAPPGGAAQP